MIIMTFIVTFFVIVGRGDVTFIRFVETICGNIRLDDDRSLGLLAVVVGALVVKTGRDRGGKRGIVGLDRGVSNTSVVISLVMSHVVDVTLSQSLII